MLHFAAEVSTEFFSVISLDFLMIDLFKKSISKLKPLIYNLIKICIPLNIYENCKVIK